MLGRRRQNLLGNIHNLVPTPRFDRPDQPVFGVSWRAVTRPIGVSNIRMISSINQRCDVLRCLFTRSG